MSDYCQIIASKKKKRIFLFLKGKTSFYKISVEIRFYTNTNTKINLKFDMFVNTIKPIIAFLDSNFTPIRPIKDDPLILSLFFLNKAQ